MKVSVAIFFCFLVIIALAEDINQFLDKTDHGVGQYNWSLDVETGTTEYELLQRRIINGSFAELGQFPYQAGLLILSYDSLFQYSLLTCGGSLVTSTKVLTAAHCWYGAEYQSENLTVVLGSLNINFGGIRIQSRHVVTHPYWNPYTSKNDIAVIYLPSAVPFSSTVAPIALPSGSELNEDFTGSMAISSGYGRIVDDDKIMWRSLRFVYFQILAQPGCMAEYGTSETNICVSGIAGGNVCEGDSGGPLVVIKNDRPILIGITSSGSDNCTDGQPSVYTRVTSYMDFLKQHNIN